ncbi:MAG TPA: large conductance mechanosensitive channel protein MscL [Clostridia bacterium]|nr:large conductance mechanosensitive channel protein MscL [Clostridia bacterium]
MWDEFKSFAIKGNMIDLAIGVVIGTAFGKIISSLVNDIITPVLSLALGRIDFSNLFLSLDGATYQTLDEAKNAGAATINYGLFLTSVIDFFLIAFSIFIVIKQINRFRAEPAPEPIITKTCPYCQSSINIDAVRCPFCTSTVSTD